MFKLIKHGNDHSPNDIVIPSQGKRVQRIYLQEQM
jgi:hypothetical protein